MSKDIIYQIKNKVSGKIYIGSTKNLRGRWNTHRSELRNNKHSNTHLQNAFNKYGADSFEFTIIEEVSDTEDLLAREQYYLDNKDPEYNIAPDAEASARGRKLTEEHKRKISESEKGCEAVKGKNQWNSKLTEKKVKIILHLLDGNSFTHKQIGKMFGVVKSTIDMVATGGNWNHVEI